MGTSSGRGQVLAGFAALGIFWGGWGASLPGVQRLAGVSNGQLGVSLLLIGGGALISMRATGYLIDHQRHDPTAWAVAALGICGILPGLARSFWSLSLFLLLLGAASGATDVSINAGGVRVESVTGRPLLQLAHASFSGAVVVASLTVGALRALGLGAAGSLLAAGIVVLAIAGWLGVPAERDHPPRRSPGTPEPKPRSKGWGLRPPAWLLLLGAMAALAYWVENAWQNWSAVHLAHDLSASPGLSALGPAAFALAAMLGRLSGQRLVKTHGDRTLIGCGAAVAAVGTAIAATAASVPVGIAGILIAGAGTSVCAPTIFSLAGAVAPPELRGAAISTATTIAYLGFLIGPAVVGALAAVSSLRSSLSAVSVLAVVLALTAALGPLPRRRRAQRSTTVTIPASRSGMP